MKRLISTSIASLSIALAGCSGETEEAPDIAEAIPLNPEGSDPDPDPDPDNGATDGSFAQGQAADGSDTPDLPGAGTGDQEAGGRALPDSMESGANPEGMTEPPAGSKVQRIDG